MKLVILALFISISATAQPKTIQKLPKHVVDSLDNLKWGIDHKPTTYHSGFVYTEQWGIKCILIDYVPVGRDMFGILEFRWIVGLNWEADIKKPLELAYTDDVWIDVATGKGFINEKNQYQSK